MSNATRALISKGGTGSKAIGELVFFSVDVARIAGVSKRQLQWWDERKVVSPRKADHRRVYAPQQVLEVLTVAALRRKGLSLQRLRRVLRVMRRQMRELVNHSSASKVYVLTDGHSVHLDDRPERILKRLTEAKKGMYLVCINDQVARMTTEKASHRYLITQLPLF